MPIDQQTFDELKGLWETVGGDSGHSDVAAAIAFAESGGCQFALAGPVDIRPVKACTWTKTDGENSCGYWQINLKAHPTYSAPDIFNEYTNARAAIKISDNGASFGAWSTYTNKAYLPYLNTYGGGKPKPPPPPPTDDGGDQTDAALSGSWASGWTHLSRTLGRGLPAQLQQSKQHRRDTLRLLRRARKVR